MGTMTMDGIEALLLKELSARGLTGGGKTLLAGVSGGADSVVLLRGLWALKKRCGFTLYAVHVEHGLRGEASLADAEFVKTLCGELAVPLLYYRVDAPAAMERLQCGAEEAARALRYGCFEKAMEERGGDALLTAHHMDDQAETVLMHLLRGSGPAGLSGMAACRPLQSGWLLRPFLSLRREELRRALAEARLPWREDETNAQPEGLRNRLRLTALPILEGLAPGCVEAMSRAAFLFGEEEGFWRQETGGWLENNAWFSKKLCFLMREALEGAPSALRRRVLRAFFERGVREMGAGMDRGMVSLTLAKTEELMRLLTGEAGRAVNLPGRIRCERSRERLFLIPPGERKTPPETLLDVPGETRFGDYVFTAAFKSPEGDLGDGVRRQALDADQLCGSVVRTRRPGDVFRLFGGGGTSPLKELLISRGVDRPFRDMLPLVARDAEILWAPGVGPSGLAKVTPETKTAAMLTVEGPLPWAETREEEQGG